VLQVDKDVEFINRCAADEPADVSVATAEAVAVTEPAVAAAQRLMNSTSRWYRRHRPFGILGTR